MSTLAAGLIGALCWRTWWSIGFAFAVPILVGVQSRRAWAATVTGAYFAAASWPLVRAYAAFAGTSTSSVSGAFAWIFAAVLLALPLTAAWTQIRSHLIPDLGEIKFEELTPALLRAILKKKAEQGMGRQVLNHLRGYLTDICRSAVAEGYLAVNAAEGLKAPVKLAKSSRPKLRVTLERPGICSGNVSGCALTW